jgi:hypothetical protein
MARRFDPDEIPELPPEYQAVLPTAKEFSTHFEKLFGQEHAVLDESGEAQPASLMQWAMWLEKDRAHRIIERTDVQRQLAGLEPDLYTVSTVFLGLNHQMMPGRKPLWFETMVFGPPYRKYYQFLKKMDTVRDDLWMERCTTRNEALAQHAEGLAWLKAHIAELDARMEPAFKHHERE